MAVASLPRQPFAELDSSRLQSLSSTKNRQNALSELLASTGKDSKALSPNYKFDFKVSSPSKRPFTLSVSDDENEDSENVDPVTSPSKRSKNIDGLPVSARKQPAGALSLGPKANHNTSPTPQRTSHFAFPSPPASAPAGRLPKPKRVGALLNKRSSLSNYKRIDPPAFGASKNKSASLPFSLDAAISGTIAKPVPNPKSSKATNLRDSVPSSWLFDIHEDTPDEEAAIMMEHSTGILDISSDDEAGPSRSKDARGKENIPPPDMTAASTAAPAKPRRSVPVDAMADEVDDRSPLGALPAEDFYAQGLDKDSVEVVPEAGETTTPTEESADEPSPRVSDENLKPSPPSSGTGSIEVERPDFIIAED